MPFLSTALVGIQNVCDSSPLSKPSAGDDISIPTRAVLKEAQTSPSDLWALVVGINKYNMGIPNLKGGVADAEAMVQYLEQKLQVPEAHIKLLVDEQATRQAIIDHLDQFANNDRIRPGTPILFYFSGHGHEAIAPDGWPTANNSITMICPSDYECSPTLDLEGQGLWDITLSTIIGNIASRKGDNITLIFDSCHSGGGAKGDDIDLSRSIPYATNYMITPELIQKSAMAIGSRAYAPAADLTKYVLIAGCKDTERAWEHPVMNRGCLSLRLLEALKKENVRTMTYRDLVNRMGILDGPPAPQSPQCEGVHWDRLIFSTATSGRRTAFYPIQQSRNDGNLMVKMSPVPNSHHLDFGTVAGITNHARLDVFEGIPESLTAAPYTTVEVHQITQFSSRLRVVNDCPRLPDDLLAHPRGLWARLVDNAQPASFQVSVQPGTTSDDVAILADALQGCQKHGQNMTISDAPAMLVLAVDGRDVLFHVVARFRDKQDEHVEQSIELLPRVPISEVDAIQRVCVAATNWLTFLSLEGGPRDTTLPQIDIECYELGLEYLNDLTIHQRLPTEPKHNLCRDRLITISEGVEYGLVLTSGYQGLDLWTSVFYFDAQDLSIREVFRPPYAVGAANDQKVNPTLSDNELGNTCIIGYGDSGWPSIKFTLPPGQNEHIGYLKVFATNETAWFFDVPQNSPFTASGALDDHEATAAAFVRTQTLLPNVECWVEQSVFRVVIKKQPVTDTT